MLVMHITIGQLDTARTTKVKEEIKKAKKKLTQAKIEPPPRNPQLLRAAFKRGPSPGCVYTNLWIIGSIDVFAKFKLYVVGVGCVVGFSQCCDFRLSHVRSVSSFLVPDVHKTSWNRASLKHNCCQRAQIVCSYKLFDPVRYPL